MSIEGLLVALILSAGVLLIIGIPLLRDTRGADPDAALREKQRERLLVYYERVLRNVRDLDEDHALGKLDDAEYQHERELWAQRGVQALKALDALNDQKPPTAHGLKRTAPDDAAVDHAIDEAIETAVRRAREVQSVTEADHAGRRGGA